MGVNGEGSVAGGWRCWCGRHRRTSCDRAAFKVHAHLVSVSVGNPFLHRCVRGTPLCVR